MAKATIDITAGSGTPVHTRTTADSVESQAVVLGIDASDSVIPADATAGLKVDTELPAAAALSDTTANPTTAMTGAGGMIYNDSTWERVKTANAIHGAALGGAGQLGVVGMSFAGSDNTVRVNRMASIDAMAIDQVQATAVMAYNGATFDRVTGDVTNGLDVDVTRHPRAATGTTSQVADTASSTSLLAANAARLGVVLTNDSSARLYVRMSAAAASTTNYSFSLSQHETWESQGPGLYTGEIRGIWATDPGDGGAKVTEMTA